MFVPQVCNRYSMEFESDSFILEKFKQFLTSLRSSNLDPPASEKTVDNLFKSALELEQIFLQEGKTRLKELLCRNYPNFNFSRSVDFLVENIIKNQHFDEKVTFHAINKYIEINSKSDFSELLKELLSEVGLRSQLFNVIEERPDVDVDLYRLNNFLCDIMNSSDLQTKVKNALKCETVLLLKSLQLAEFLTAQILMDEVITCLECQTDLRLWFLLMREENLQTVLELCATFSNFLKAVLKFFDKFASEMESIYDEELNVMYSHVNLDFEDFVKIIQLFLNKEGISKIVSEFLESKNLTDKNFIFWVDIKSCL